MAWTQEGKAITLRIPKKLWGRLERIWETNKYNHMKQGEFIKQLLNEYANIIETELSDQKTAAINHNEKGDISGEDIAK